MARKTKAEFIKFVNSRKLTSMTSGSMRIYDCPLAQFYGSKFPPSDIEYDKLPKWAINFMDQFDAIQGKTIRDARKVAKELWGNAA